MTAEEWRPIPGFPGYYVSDLGRVLSTRNKKVGPILLRPGLASNGYFTVSPNNGRQQTRTVHSLVAEAFHGPRPAGMDTRHLDGDKSNNRADNLCYGTRSENELDKVRHGVNTNASKTHCPAGHPYSPENTRIDPSSGSRRCRTCLNAKRRAYRALARAS